MHGITAAAGVHSTLPINTVAPPTPTGTHLLGDTLTGSTGTWTGSPAPTYAYQWTRAGVDIVGATSSTRILVAADIGRAIGYRVTATNSAGSASADSAATVAFYPTDIATCEQVYDPALGVTVTGQGVSAWVDQATATATNLAQSTDAKRMPLTASSLTFSNQPIVSGSGTGTVARATTAADCTYQHTGAGMSVYAVIQWKGTLRWLNDTMGGGSIAIGFSLFSAPTSTLLRVSLGNGTVSVISADYLMSFNAAHKMCVTHKTGDTGSDLHVYKDGSVLAATVGNINNAAAPSASAPAQVFALGNFSSAAPNAAGDDIAIWCGFSSVLTTTQRQTMDAYCANRFGIAG